MGREGESQEELGSRGQAWEAQNTFSGTETAPARALGS